MVGGFANIFENKIEVRFGLAAKDFLPLRPAIEGFGWELELRYWIAYDSTKVVIDIKSSLTDG